MGHGEVRLVSSETFFFDIAEGNETWELIRGFGSSVEILFYVRDVFDHLVSHWGQLVKRRGYSGTLEQCAAGFNAPARTRLVIERLRQAGTAFRIANYSRHSHDLEGHFAHVLLGDLASDFLEKCRKFPHPVNRSLAVPELEFLRAYNRYYVGEEPQHLADELVNRLPHIEVTPPFIGSDTVAKVQGSVGEDVAFINQFLTDSEQVSIAYKGPRAANPDDVFCFNAEQLRVIAQTVCSDRHGKIRQS
jgi:hypothetical protein